MEAIKSLIVEHQQMGRLADALEVYAGRTKLRQGEKAPDLVEFAAVFAEFGECIHHEKEERILLPALSRHGFSWDTGALAAVRREHRHETYLIDVLRLAGERAAFWNDEDRGQVAGVAQALVDFQRKHHALETSRILPLVERLSAEELSRLRAALDRFDLEHAERRALALQRVVALIARYAPPAQPDVPVLLSDMDEVTEARPCCLAVDE